MRNNDSKEPALRFDSYKFLFHRARLATFATQSAKRRHSAVQQISSGRSPDWLKMKNPAAGGLARGGGGLGQPKVGAQLRPRPRPAFLPQAQRAGPCCCDNLSSLPPASGEPSSLALWYQVRAIAMSGRGCTTAAGCDA